MHIVYHILKETPRWASLFTYNHLEVFTDILFTGHDFAHIKVC